MKITGKKIIAITIGLGITYFLFMFAAEPQITKQHSSRAYDECILFYTEIADQRVTEIKKAVVESEEKRAEFINTVDQDLQVDLEWCEDLHKM